MLNESQGGNAVNFLDTLPGVADEEVTPVPPTTAYMQWGGIDTPFAQHRSGSIHKPPPGMGQPQ